MQFTGQIFTLDSVVVISKKDKLLWKLPYLCYASSQIEATGAGVFKTCLSADTCLIADPGVDSSIPVRFHTFVEIDHEIISTAILLPSDCYQTQSKVYARSTG